ncbi:hypothetical protein ABW19_dt0210152 [Dactylella cylindrospora]|nr:hypothetical protein ABW19_dt0210152 [Dactylella cylindrospora]
MGGSHTFHHRFEIIQPPPAPVTSKREVLPPPPEDSHVAGQSSTGSGVEESGWKTVIGGESFEKEGVARMECESEEHKASASALAPGYVAAASSPATTPALPTPDIWTQLVGPGDVIHEIATKLFDVIFDYIDSTYEPFGAGELSAEKFVHSRCFWMSVDKKKAVFQNAARMGNYRHHENIRDWNPLTYYLGGLKLSPRTTYKTYQFETPNREWKLISPKYLGYEIRTPHLSRHGFQQLCICRMLGYPGIVAGEIGNMLDILPEEYRRRLPRGKPGRELFPQRGHDGYKSWLWDELGGEMGLRFIIGEESGEDEKYES